jgi:hypothetical protein
MFTPEDTVYQSIAAPEKPISEEPLGASSDDADEVGPTFSGLPAPQEADWGAEVQAKDLSAFVTKVGKDPVSGGGFGDVFKGIWNQMDPNSNSVVKKIRVLSSGVESSQRQGGCDQSHSSNGPGWHAA